MKQPKKLTITLPSLDGQEPTKLEGEQYNFRGGPSVFVLYEAADNLGPQLDKQMRRELVNGLDEINKMQKGRDAGGIYYMEYEPELGKNCYRQFNFNRDQDGRMQQIGSDGIAYTEEQFYGLIERLEAMEQQTRLTSPNWQEELNKPNLPAPEPGENLNAPERRIEGPLGPSWTEEASLPQMPQRDAERSTEELVKSQNMGPEPYIEPEPDD